jgi:hypothetical protein
MGAQIPQLQNVTDAAKTFASIGLQGMAQRHGLQAKADLDLRNALALRDNELSTRMGLGKMQMEAAQTASEDMMAGQETAMLDWAGNVIQQFEPNSPEYKQAERTLNMLKSRKRGSAAYNKGYLDYGNERNIWDMLSQGALGAAGWQPAKKPTPAANKKPLSKPAPQGYGDDDLHS